MHRIVCVAILLATVALNAAERSANETALLKNADALMEAGKPVEALAEYKKLLQLAPNDGGVLWNAGLAAQSVGDNALALDCWKKLRVAEPGNWKGLSKLIQAYQAGGQTAERDAVRKELFDLRAKGNDAELAKEARYCRELLKVHDRNVLVLEYFELKGDKALKYEFHVLNDKHETDYRLSVGSYDSINKMVRDQGQLKEGERAFHLDGYFNIDRSHKAYAMWVNEPTYETAREAVMKVIDAREAPPEIAPPNPNAPAPAEPKK